MLRLRRLSVPCRAVSSTAARLCAGAVDIHAHSRSASCRTIDIDAVLAHTKTLSSDEFEGRAPGTKGEELTVDLPRRSVQEARPEAGQHRRHLHPEGAARRHHADAGAARVQEGRAAADAEVERRRRGVDQARGADRRASTNSELVFVGYGVVAPEFNWDDYKGVDVKGKTLVMLVNDPPVPDPANAGELDAEDVRRQGDDLLRPLDLQVRDRRAEGRRRRAHRPRDRSGRLSASTSCRARPASSSISSRRTRTWAASPIEGWITLDQAQDAAADGRAGLRRAERSRPRRASSSRCRSA